MATTVQVPFRIIHACSSATSRKETDQDEIAPLSRRTSRAHAIANRAMNADLVGWVSSAILLATLIRQVHTQWKSERAEGLSRWLFVGQVTASAGFATYSWLLQNWVFFATNIALLLTAIAGEVIYLRNLRREQRKKHSVAAEDAH